VARVQKGKEGIRGLSIDANTKKREIREMGAESHTEQLCLSPPPKKKKTLKGRRPQGGGTTLEGTSRSVKGRAYEVFIHPDDRSPSSLAKNQCEGLYKDQVWSGQDCRNLTKGGAGRTQVRGDSGGKGQVASSEKKRGRGHNQKGLLGQFNGRSPRTAFAKEILLKGLHADRRIFGLVLRGP